jgi:hypothetical protein
MNKFDKKFNYDDVFLRSLTLGAIAEFSRKVRWINRWIDDKGNTVEKLITVPVYYSMVGDDRFLLDAFVDEITNSKRPELNIDPKPRAHIQLENATIKREEYANPNVDIEYFKEENGVLKKLIGKNRFLPIKATFHIEILLGKEIELMKCKEALWEFFFAYKFFYITHNGYRIDCILDIPDDKESTITREIEGIKNAKDVDKYIKFNFDIHSYFPIEPIETPPIVATNCNRVIFKGNVRTLSSVSNKKSFIGGNINKK